MSWKLCFENAEADFAPLYTRVEGERVARLIRSECDELANLANAAGLSLSEFSMNVSYYRSSTEEGVDIEIIGIF